MKKGLLYSYYSQLEEWAKNHNIQLELFKGRIAEFKKQNDDHMNQLNKQIGDLQREYFVVIDNMIQMDGKDPRLLDGKTRYSFDENWKMLMLQYVGTKFKSETYEQPVEKKKTDEPPVADGYRRERFEDGTYHDVLIDIKLEDPHNPNEVKAEA